MAITLDGKVYRNLQEQVKKNQDDIADLKANPVSTFGDITTDTIYYGALNARDSDVYITTNQICNLAVDTAININDNIEIYDPVSNELAFKTNYTASTKTFEVTIADTTVTNAENIIVHMFDNLNILYNDGIIEASGYTLNINEVTSQSEITNYLTIKEYETAAKANGIYSYNDGVEYLAAYFVGKKLNIESDLNLRSRNELSFRYIVDESGSSLLYIEVTICRYSLTSTSDGDFYLVIVESDGDAIYYGFSNYIDENNVDLIVTDVSGHNQYNLILNSSELSTLKLKSLSKIYYRHNVTIDISNAGTFTFTTTHSKNTPIDSIQDLTTMLGNTTLAGCGQILNTFDAASIANKLVVGTSISDTYFECLDSSTVDFVSIGAYTIVDNVTAINANAQ